MAQLGAGPRIAVVQFPGVNCEYETARALQATGLHAEIIRWNAPPATGDFDGFVLPGGFSYQDRVRAGAISAREPILELLTGAAESGAPILGICNGAQVLVEAGLVPGSPPGDVRMALAANRMPARSGYYTRWVYLRVTSVACAFTEGLDAGTLLPMPVAHGEGRFTTADPVLRDEFRKGERVAFQYATPRGDDADGFPTNPNESIEDAAGVVGGGGNVLALMPHPERACWLWQLPLNLPGPWGDERRRWARGDAATSLLMGAAGPGREIFSSLARYLGVSPS